jgi:soluble lytic murein transglycosylase-like protein
VAAWWDRPIVYGAALVGAAALALGPGGGIEYVTNGPVQEGLIRALADKWARVFGVRAEWVMAIAKIESAFRPGARSKPGASDDTRGGAWGAMQVTLATAQGLAPELARSTNPTVRATFARYDAAKSLLDADVGILFGTYLLSKHQARFGIDFPKVAAAYNQGAGTVGKLVSAGTFPTGLTVHGKDYVAKTETARKVYAA